MTPLSIAEDRGMVVDAGRIVRTGYVAIEDVILASKDRMAIGDVERAMQRRMAAAPGSPWPCPVGEWRGHRFQIFDGRHEFMAAQMLGCTHILVAWVDADVPISPEDADLRDHDG